MKNEKVKVNYYFVLPQSFLDEVKQVYPEEQAQELLKWLVENPIETPYELFRFREDVPEKAMREKLAIEFCRRLDWYFEEYAEEERYELQRLEQMKQNGTC